jgi:hypothetical protein
MYQSTYDIDWLIKTYMTFFTKFGMDEPNLRLVYSEQGGDVLDFAWGVFQKIVDAVNRAEIGDEQRYRTLKEIYFEMVLFQRRHMNELANHIMQIKLRYELLHHIAQTDLICKVTVIGNCKYSMAKRDKEYSINKALETPPIDTSKCKREYGCVCCYGFVPQRNKSGNLLKRKPS